MLLGQTQETLFCISTDVQQLLVVKVEQDWRPGLGQEDPTEVFYINEELEEEWTNQEADITSLTFTRVKSEDDDDEEKSQSSQQYHSELKRTRTTLELQIVRRSPVSQ